MGSQKPIIGSSKPDLVAVILERSVAQQLALALAWALGTTGGGKSNSKGGGYSIVTKEPDQGVKPKAVGAPKKLGVGAPKAFGAPKAIAAFKAVGAPKAVSQLKSAGATKAGAKKAGAKKAGAKKSGTKKS